MSNDQSDQRRDAMLLRALKTPPQPRAKRERKPKAKPESNPPAEPPKA